MGDLWFLPRGDRGGLVADDLEVMAFCSPYAKNDSLLSWEGCGLEVEEDFEISAETFFSRNSINNEVLTFARGVFVGLATALAAFICSNSCQKVGFLLLPLLSGACKADFELLIDCDSQRSSEFDDFGMLVRDWVGLEVSAFCSRVCQTIVSFPPPRVPDVFESVLDRDLCPSDLDGGLFPSGRDGGL